MTYTYETALATNGAYRVERGDYLIGRFITCSGAVKWSYVASPWSNEASTIQTLLRNVPAAVITRVEEEN